MNTVKKMWLATTASLTNCMVALAAPSGDMMGGINSRAANYSTYIDTEETPLTVIGNIIEFILLMLGVVAVAMIIYAGVKIITAGNDDGLSEGKKMVQYAVVGLCVVIVAYTIVNWVTGGTSFLFGGDTSLQ